MSGKNQSLVDQFLHGKESIAEVFGILHAGNFVTYLAQIFGFASDRRRPGKMQVNLLLPPAYTIFVV